MNNKIIYYLNILTALDDIDQKLQVGETVNSLATIKFPLASIQEFDHL